MAADSTMLRMVKRLMALSLGTQRAQLEQRTGLVWPRPFLLRPLEINQHQVLQSLHCATQSPISMFRNAPRCFCRSIRSGVFEPRSPASLRRSCRLGDFAADSGRNRPYLFALFLTILTDCSVEGQKSEQVVVEQSEWGGSVRVTCRVGLSKLAHTKALRDWIQVVVLWIALSP